MADVFLLLLSLWPFVNTFAYRWAAKNDDARGNRGDGANGNWWQMVAQFSPR